VDEAAYGSGPLVQCNWSDSRRFDSQFDLSPLGRGEWMLQWQMGSMSGVTFHATLVSKTSSTVTFRSTNGTDQPVPVTAVLDYDPVRFVVTGVTVSSGGKSIRWDRPSNNGRIPCGTTPASFKKELGL
jgi:hypothetical protein